MTSAVGSCPPESAFVTVRFKLADTTLRRSQHPAGYDFYEGTHMRYFAGKPVMWWPEVDAAGLEMLEHAAGKMTFVASVEGDRTSPMLVEMTLPREDLVREKRCPYTIVG